MRDEAERTLFWLEVNASGWTFTDAPKAAHTDSLADSVERSAPIPTAPSAFPLALALGGRRSSAGWVDRRTDALASGYALVPRASANAASRGQRRRVA